MVNRHSNLRNTQHKPGEGMNYAGSRMTTGLAKDSLGTGKNTTQTFKPSGSPSGPYGARNTNK